jgi:hypothetical protein
VYVASVLCQMQNRLSHDDDKGKVVCLFPIAIGFFKNKYCVFANNSKLLEDWYICHMSSVNTTTTGMLYTW